MSEQSTFPKLHIIPGFGFDHELADDDGRIYASIYGSPENLRLAQLFACALDLLEALKQLLAEADDPSMAAREAAHRAIKAVEIDPHHPSDPLHSSNPSETP